MAADSPARHIYVGTGSQRVFPIPTKIISDDYIRIEINGDFISNRTTWDIVNNSIIFVTAPANGATIDVQVATSEEALSLLGSISNIDIVAEDIVKVSIVGDNIDNVNNVGNNISNVNAVANDLININIVATNVNNVNNVGNNITNVNNVASALTNINTVAPHVGNIDTVAPHVGNIDTVAPHVGNIDTVAPHLSNIDKVGINVNNVNTVADNVSNINTIIPMFDEIQTIIPNIGSVEIVGDDLSNYFTNIEDNGSILEPVESTLGVSYIKTVADNITNVNTVGNSITNVNTVSSHVGNIDTVAPHVSNIDTVSGHVGNIDTIAPHVTNIDTVASHISNIDIVATNITDVNTFANTYYISDTAPTIISHPSLTKGDLWYDRVNSIVKSYDGTNWNPAYGVAIASESIIFTNKTLDDVSNWIGANHLHYKTKATEAITAGNVVMAVGYNSGEDAYEIAKWTVASGKPAIGIAEESIATGSFGRIVQAGIVKNIDTSGLTLNAIHYPANGGLLTATQPTTGTYQACAYVMRVHGSQGALLASFNEPVSTINKIANDLGTTDFTLDLGSL